LALNNNSRLRRSNCASRKVGASRPCCFRWRG